MFRIGELSFPGDDDGEERMETPGDVAVMLRLAELGWGSKRIAGELGPSGRQLQIDFGSTFVEIGEEVVRVYLFVATLGYSRRGHAFARYWGFRPRACAPYRARTKGKDENGVGYVKKNAIAGHRFASWAALEAHLVRWMREVADQRIHGTTGEPPIERFRREEAAALAPSWPAAVPAGVRGGPACAGGRLGRSRHQPLQRTLAADRRPGAGRGDGWRGVHLPRRGGGRPSRRAPRPA